MIMQNKIAYEQPLNERMRNFLRLEHLFNLIDFRSQEASEWDCRTVLESLLEINGLLNRSDLKTELIKELKRHISILASLKNNPAVNENRLNSINNNMTDLLTILCGNNYHPGTLLKDDELITSIKQRTSIPGGTCAFDLPRFHYWLSQPSSIRRKDLIKWMTDLEPIKKSTFIAIDMVRNSSDPISEKAETGFYQRPLDPSLSCQLIRVFLPTASRYYPEISGGKHRFTIRFMEESTTDFRPAQSKNDINFELHCCIL
jgi:cell division protein ZapD|tara:strand:- start:388 stop:1164 length:777 start_codon:yes stop_codon:yes gene_type:complete